MLISRPHIAENITLTDLGSLIDTKARCRALAAAASARRSELTGLAGSSAALILSALPATAEKPVLVIGDSADDAGYLFFDLCRFAGEEAVAMLPSGFKRDIKYGQPDPPAQILRTETLTRIAARKVRFIVTYPDALAECVASAKELGEHTLDIAVGSSIDLRKTTDWLRENGFTHVDYVFEPGQYAVRGSILDIYGYSAELPVRIDLFGDEVDSLRSFNVETQLSEAKHDAVAITANVTDRAALQSLLEFLPPDTLIAVRDPLFTVERIKIIAATDISAFTLLSEEGNAEALDVVVDAADFEARLDTFRRMTFTAAKPEAKKSAGTRRIDFDFSPQGIYHKNFDLISQSFTSLLTDGYRLLITSDNPRQFDRLREIFADRGDRITFEGVLGTVHEGFVDNDLKICVFTDHQIFDRFHKYTLRSERARSGKMALSMKELGQVEFGDYIVHQDHGVGKFAGLLRTETNGRMREMIKLVYADNDILLVSIHNLHKLSKYRGKEGVPPKIYRLGSGAWSRMKDRTKSKLKDIARDLIKLYAARRQQKGFAFSPDSYMQHELEASFIYEDTPDQLTATNAVKADMESDRPMERLICGDVGFGKTEIAIRAAFKAAVDGKQVAVLVPTTVLAYQHFHTFSERLADFPVRVEYLSRARSPKETKQILADLADGKIDIIVGTHKLIGKSVSFKDLGLLIVDEEQKFGVAVKERLKHLKTNIDTLTMSATPIPRTLQFSLMGARDFSAITTPPPNRYPIITSVNSLSDDVISEAVNFELARGGQVFVVNHRIEGLPAIEEMLHRIAPDARVAVAHGQMPVDRLEKTIADFAAHDYDILLSTTIIESGIDMPNVNTIIINNAQNFGLSELHQLRGRVGRSSRKAFCYLTVPPDKPLTPDARRRLQAIESFSDLGSGIQIAMQDLDIRGAGNLLGAEQSGFIADLGYETYKKVLEEAVLEIRNEEFPDLVAETGAEDSAEFVAECNIETDLELLLPSDYVAQSSERMALYKELDKIETDEELATFEANLEDRFGRIPDAARELLKVPVLRRLARKLGIEKLVIKQNTMYTYFVSDENKAYYQSPMFGRMINYLQQNHRRVQIRERNGRRSFVFADVPTVAEATDIVRSILALDAI